MRTVFSSHSEVAHIWAQRPWTNGGTPEGRASRIFFERDSIYSYGYHYELARHLDPSTVLINNEGYSVSTSKHIGIVRDATSHKRQYYTMSTDIDLVAEQIEDLLDKLENARKPELYFPEVESLLTDFFDFHENTEFSDLDKRRKEYRRLKSVKAENLEKWEAARPEIEAREERARELEAAREEKRKKKLAADRVKFRAEWDQAVKEWKNYERTQLIVRWEFRNLYKDLLRVSEDGTQVETSRGVKVPISAARTLYALIKKGIDVRGHKIEYYTVTAINGTLKIGCHDIDMDSVREVGEEILRISYAK